MAALRRAMRSPSCTRAGLPWPPSWADTWILRQSSRRSSMRESAAASLQACYRSLGEAPGPQTRQGLVMMSQHKVSQGPDSGS